MTCSNSHQPYLITLFSLWPFEYYFLKNWIIHDTLIKQTNKNLPEVIFNFLGKAVNILTQRGKK